jgi:hypothetical protein
MPNFKTICDVSVSKYIIMKAVKPTGELKN